MIVEGHTYLRVRAQQATVVSMDDLSLPEVRRLVAAANAVRQQRDTSGSAMESDGPCAERQLDAIFTARCSEIGPSLCRCVRCFFSRPTHEDDGHQRVQHAKE